MESVQRHRSYNDSAHARKSMCRPVWTGKRETIIEGPNEEISWCLSRKSEKDTKTSTRGVISSVLDLNFTFPNAK